MNLHQPRHHTAAGTKIEIERKHGFFIMIITIGKQHANLFK